MAPKGFLTAASEGVLRALFLAPFPAAPEAALAGALPPAFPGGGSEAIAAARTGAPEALPGAAPHTAIEAALEVRYPVRYAARTEPGIIVRFTFGPGLESDAVLLAPVHRCVSRRSPGTSEHRRPGARTPARSDPQPGRLLSACRAAWCEGAVPGGRLTPLSPGLG